MMAESGHYPYQVEIDAYGGGGFRFAEMSHRGSLLCLPSGMQSWDMSAAQMPLTLAALTPILDCSQEIDVLLIGQGHDIAFLGVDIRKAFEERNVVVEAMATGAAVRTYNVLMAEKRAVGAALIAVEGPK